MLVNGIEYNKEIIDATQGGMMASYMSGNDSQINTYTGEGVRVRKEMIIMSREEIINRLEYLITLLDEEA